MKIEKEIDLRMGFEEVCACIRVTVDCIEIAEAMDDQDDKHLTNDVLTLLLKRENCFNQLDDFQRMKVKEALNTLHARLDDVKK
jgi:hypothetical protein